ncbi:hypothetical protein [Thiolapillus sp.]|uniref:hypothetical protein n=1 Tax=Thiolapillus sp. TaxID=2017437 RepID=UPI003AF68CB4
MTQGNTKPTLEEVLDAYAVEAIHDRATLESYLRDFPQFAEELVDLSREVSRVVEYDEGSLSATEEALIEKAWQNHAQPVARSADEIDPLAKLSVPQLREVAHQLGVPRQVITAFRERRVKLESVPKSFLAAFARALSCTVDLLSSVISETSGSDFSRSYKAEIKPTAGEAISFEKLLIDAGVSEAKRTELLAENK